MNDDSFLDVDGTDVDTITETARVFTSNVAPAISAGQKFQLSGFGDGAMFSIEGTDNTLATLLAALQADATTSQFGTWSIQGGNTIQLSTLVLDNAALILAIGA
jgi:hypothetical protein